MYSKIFYLDFKKWIFFFGLWSNNSVHAYSSYGFTHLVSFFLTPILVILSYLHLEINLFNK